MLCNGNGFQCIPHSPMVSLNLIFIHAKFQGEQDGDSPGRLYTGSFMF